MNKKNNSKKTFFSMPILNAITAVAITVTVFFSGFSAVIAETEDIPVSEKPMGKINARSAVLMDAKSGNILFEKEADKRLYPASCTKILSVIVVIENADLTDIVTVSNNAVMKGISHRGAHIALRPGEKITVEDALYGALLVSANDCIIALGEHVAGSEKAFVEMMNKKAAELEMNDSHFANTCGLFHKEHYSSARDLAIAMNYAIKNETFVKILGTSKHVIPKSNKCDEKRYLYNNHRMIRFHSFEYEGVVGGKKGYITESKFNLVTYVKRGDMDLIAVVMKGSGSDKNCKDTIKMFDHYYKGYKAMALSKKNINAALGKDGTFGVLGKKAEVSWERPFKVIVPKSTTKKQLFSGIKITATEEAGLCFPVKKHSTVGKLTAEYNGKTVGYACLFSKEKVESNTAIFKKVLKITIPVLMILTVISLFFLRRRASQRNIEK
ncbi:MAG TPA: D-alanyl-D-alanine carboxypeptidase family protein [Bacillota bacterium]|nr:D-alanyl-D-alanine carboxypeptidase family protein [Bacillota bacterium]